MANDDPQIIRGPVDLVRAWQKGILSEVGIVWHKQPPALQKALDRIEQEERNAKDAKRS